MKPWMRVEICKLCNQVMRISYLLKEVDMAKDKKQIPWYLWPFWVIWRLFALIIEFTGRLVGAILGLVLLIVGVILSLTVVGAVVGVPIIIVGFLLILRSMF